MPATPSDHKKKSPKYGKTWKKGGGSFDLDLPSGERCRVKRPGIQGLIKAGILQSIDSLTAIVQTETIPKAEGKPAVDVKDILADEQKFSKMLEMVDKIVCEVVLEPKVLPTLVQAFDQDGETLVGDDGEALMREIEDDERDEDSIYVDYIDTEDKMFIMNFVVGGSKDLAQFRQKSKDAMGSLSASES